MNAQPVAPAATEYLYRKAAAAGVPLSGSFELTPVCNMDCKMCYVRLSHREQEAISPLANAEKWLQLGKDALDAGMLYLLITGGEPFLHPEIRQILEGLHKMGLLITINTNGTLIDERIMQWLVNCPPIRVNVSLYGASDETYRKLCGNPKGFTQAVNAIELLTKAGISVKINCSLTPYNAADLPQIVEFAKNNNLIHQVATYMFPPVRKDETSIGQNRRFTPEEAAYYMAYGEYLTLGKERFAALEHPTPTPDEDCNRLGDGVRCRAGRCSFWVTWQGHMTPCGMFPPADSPNVFHIPFAEAWEQVKKDTAAITLPSQCAGCNAKDLCHACAAMVITESGNFQTPPKYRCDMMHAYSAQWERVKAENP